MVQGYCTTAALAPSIAGTPRSPPAPTQSPARLLSGGHASSPNTRQYEEAAHTRYLVRVKSRVFGILNNNNNQAWQSFSAQSPVPDPRFSGLRAGREGLPLVTVSPVPRVGLSVSTSLADALFLRTRSVYTTIPQPAATTRDPIQKPRAMFAPMASM